MAAIGITHRWLMPPRLRVTPSEPLSLRSFACSSSTVETWRPTSPGINRVVFNVTPAAGTFRGQDGIFRSGTTPVVVTQQSPILTDRFFYSAYEYTLAATDFSTSTSFTVQPVAYTQASGGASRAEGTYTFYADPTGTARQKRRAYIDFAVGVDGTQAIDNPATPFKTYSGARTRMLALVSDPLNLGGCEFLFKAGQTHLVNSSGTIPSTGEWIIFGSWGGNKSDTALHRGSAAINKSSSYVRFIGLRIKSNAYTAGAAVCTGSGGGLLTDDCDIEGYNRYGTGSYVSEPFHAVGEYWSRNCDWHKCRYGRPQGSGPLKMALCTNWYEIGEDVLVLNFVAVGCRARDVDPGAAGSPGAGSGPLGDNAEHNHADGIQWHVAPVDGVPTITSVDNPLYAYLEFTDLHYQGVFCRMYPGACTDWSFINCVFEMRHPVRDYGPGDVGGLGAFWGNWESPRKWHCNFHMRQNTEQGGGGRTVNYRSETDATPDLFGQSQVSYVGCYYESFNSGFGSGGGAWALAGNAFGNVIAHNHYNLPAGGEKKTPDTIGGTKTEGDTGVIDSTIGSARFLRPLDADSPLVRDSFVPMIAWDLVGRPRSLTAATVGAYEFEGTAPTPPPATDPEECIQRRGSGAGGRQSRFEEMKRRGRFRWQDSFSPSAVAPRSPRASRRPSVSSRRQLQPQS